MTNKSNKIKVNQKEIPLNGTDMKKHEKIVPDTSVIIDGVITDLVDEKELKKPIVIIPKFVLEELQSQASQGREIGFKGLEELKKMKSFEKENNLEIKTVGRRQTMDEIKLAKFGRIDSLIMETAKEEQAVLYTSDRVQALAAEAEGIEVQYFEPYEKKDIEFLEKYMTKDTMSLHLKEGCRPLAKKGKPGNIKLQEVSNETLTREEIENIITDIEDSARYSPDSFIEISGHEANVIQLSNMRISICRPPFSDAIEVTIVRPILKAILDDYKLSEKLKKRLADKAEGIMIAGPPGSGKSTFAAAVAEFYENQGKIVKTMETPRDLQVKPEITQYTQLKGSFAKTADILLLVRPDYTIFDEIRQTPDFRTFSDLRLSGIGMIGVVHATQTIDAIQRFVGRVELGMIPHILDTIIFIEGGIVKDVYSLNLTVRSPTGMNESDLARPLVEVKDFSDGSLIYEIYTFGEETVVIPVGKRKESSLLRLAKKQIERELKKYDKKCEIEFLSDERVSVRIDNKKIPKIIGKSGSNISKLEEKIGISIDVLPKVATLGKQVDYDYEEKGSSLVFSFGEKMKGKELSFYSNKEYIFSATAGNKGQVKINKTSEIGEKVLKAVISNTLQIFS